LPFADRPKELGDLDRCRFLEASAADLAALQELSVDVTTTRAVLIYVEAKQQAFDEFFRVLRPGGRISLYEPINRLGMSNETKSCCGSIRSMGWVSLRQGLRPSTPICSPRKPTDAQLRRARACAAC
jgi:ubiquinone/menaquinone biosynthesis C-methylase UbiE